MSEIPDEDEQRKSNEIEQEEPTFDLDLDETGQKLPRSSSHEIKEEEDEDAIFDRELDPMCQDAQRRYELRQEYHDDDNDVVKVLVESIKEDEQKELHEVKTMRRELTDEENTIDHPLVIHDAEREDYTCSNLNENAANLQESHAYREGDLVWAKPGDNDIWWPGKVRDLTDGSGRVCVALFEYGSTLWFLTAEVRPFVSHFSEMSTRDASPSFKAAVEKAVGEVSRLVSDNMVCRCVRRKSRLEPGADSLTRLSIPSYEARKVVSILKELAKTATSFEKGIEIGVLRGWLYALRHFSRARMDLHKGKRKAEVFNVDGRPIRIEVSGLKKTSVAALVVNYSAGCRLPSIGKLISDYGEFGPLKLSQTRLLVDKHSAFVAYKRFRDSEAAFKSLILRSERSFEIKSIGNYWLSSPPTDHRGIFLLEPDSDSKEASFALVLAFSKSFPLPSKEQIVAHYEKYGTLSVQQTQVSVERHSAFVVYEQAVNCEAAFKSSLTCESPFEVVDFGNYWMRRIEMRL